MHYSIVNKLIWYFFNINICLRKYQNQHQTIWHIRSINYQFVRSIVCSFRCIFEFRIANWFTRYSCVNDLRIVFYVYYNNQHDIVVVNNINNLIYLSYQTSNFVQKWMIIYQLNVFLFCETNLSTFSLFRVRIFRLLIRKFRICICMHLFHDITQIMIKWIIQSIFFLFFYFFIFLFYSQFYRSLFVVYIFLFQFVDYNTFVCFNSIIIVRSINCSHVCLYVDNIVISIH